MQSSHFSSLAFAVLGLFVGAQVARAQQPDPAASPVAEAPAPAPDQTPAAEVSDEEIETFATIYVELQQTAERYEQEIAAVESEQEAQAVQARMQQESINALEKHGWTPDKFNRVSQALNQSPALSEKTLRLIQEKS